VTPNHLFLLFVAGMLAVYAADAFPLSRFVRFAGVGAVAAAVYLAPSHPIRLTGSILLLTTVVLFAVDFWSKIDYLAGSAAAVLMPIGFMLLYSGPQGIDSSLAISLGFLLSSATTTYCWKAKRARLNKLADL
jgi:hypothetical protein